MTDQLEVLFPTGKEITLSGRQFVIKPFTFGQLPKVLKAVKKSTKMIEEQGISTSNVNSEAVLTILSESGTDLIDLLSEIMAVEKDFIEGLQVDEAIILITSFIEVNSDFFSKKVAPVLQAALKR